MAATKTPMHTKGGIHLVTTPMHACACWVCLRRRPPKRQRSHLGLKKRWGGLVEGEGHDEKTSARMGAWALSTHAHAPGPRPSRGATRSGGSSRSSSSVGSTAASAAAAAARAAAAAAASFVTEGTHRMHTALEIYGVGAEENLLHERAAALTKFAVGESASSGGTHSTGATTPSSH